VPGCPFPAFSTASIARTRIVSTDRRSTSDHSKVLTPAPCARSSGGRPQGRHHFDPTHRAHPAREPLAGIAVNGDSTVR